MRYVSTRGETPPVEFGEAVAAGLAPDGGLFVPEALPDFSADLDGFAGLPYPELCTRFLSRFATDIPVPELRELVARSFADVVEHEAWTGPGTLELRPNAQLPVHLLTVGEVVLALHRMLDLTLAPGTVVHTYPERRR